MFNRRRSKSKYNAKRTERVGRSFASKGEADCFSYLTLLKNAGEIRNLECQVTVRLTEAKLRWVLDFKFFDVKLNREVWADFKGLETVRWLQLVKLWPHYGVGLLRVYKGQGLRMRVAYEVRPQGEMT